MQGNKTNHLANREKLFRKWEKERERSIETIPVFSSWHPHVYQAFRIP